MDSCTGMVPRTARAGAASSLQSAASASMPASALGGGAGPGSRPSPRGPGLKPTLSEFPAYRPGEEGRANGWPAAPEIASAQGRVGAAAPLSPTTAPTTAGLRQATDAAAGHRAAVNSGARRDDLATAKGRG